MRSPCIAGEVREVLAGGLVTLTIASNAGLQRGQTLSVARLGPRAGFLGQIQIVDVKDTLAVGRVKLQPGADIKPGNRVTFKDQAQ